MLEKTSFEVCSQIYLICPRKVFEHLKLGAIAIFDVFLQPQRGCRKTPQPIVVSKIGFKICPQINFLGLPNSIPTLEIR
jgi:hypothetical protein